MKKCPACHAPNQESQEYCTQCGEPLPVSPPSEITSTRSKSTKSKKAPILLAALAVFVIGLGISYFVMKDQYSQEAVTDEFLDAVMHQKQNNLKQMITPKDSRIQVDDESIAAFLALMEKNPSLLSNLENSLTGESVEDMFTIREDGRKFVVFPNYVVTPIGYVLQAEAIGEETHVSMGDKELGVLTAKGDLAEYGPFIAGMYPITLAAKVDAEDVNEQFPASLHGPEVKIDLATASAELKKWQTDLAAKQQADQEQAQKDAEEKEKAEQAAKDEKEKKSNEKVVVKEVVKEVPVASNGYNNYYIIPYSGEAYLSASDIQGLSKSQLRIARNEIYARYGYVFDSKDLQNYFSSQAWYTPNASYSGALTDWEKQNVELIKSYE